MEIMRTAIQIIYETTVLGEVPSVLLDFEY